MAISPTSVRPELREESIKEAGDLGSIRRLFDIRILVQAQLLQGTVGRRCDDGLWETQVSACLRSLTPAMTCFVIVCKSVSDLECMPVTFRQDSHRLE